jgi:hypothetical protein
VRDQKSVVSSVVFVETGWNCFRTCRCSLVTKTPRNRIGVHRGRHLTYALESPSHGSRSWVRVQLEYMLETWDHALLLALSPTCGTCFLLAERVYTHITGLQEIRKKQRTCMSVIAAGHQDPHGVRLHSQVVKPTSWVLVILCAALGARQRRRVPRRVSATQGMSRELGHGSLA